MTWPGLRPSMKHSLSLETIGHLLLVPSPQAALPSIKDLAVDAEIIGSKDGDGESPFDIALRYKHNP